MIFEQVAGNICYPECPRWHDGQVWFSSVFSGEVCTINEGNSISIQHKFDTPIAGLGWLTYNTLLVVQPLEQTITRIIEKDNHQLYCDLAQYDQVINNDLFVDRTGNAYVSGMGNNYINNEPAKPCSIIKISNNKEVKYAADEMLCPNGFAFDQDRQRLYIAESNSDRITRFDFSPDGILSNRTAYFKFNNGDSPDGISLDKQGRLWVACNNHKVVLIDNSRIVESIEFEQHPLACLVAGEKLDTLYVLTTDSFIPDEVQLNPNGRIYKAKLSQ